MGRAATVAYDDRAELREDVQSLMREGRIRHHLGYLKRKGHVEVDRRIINAVLLHGRYAYDSEHRKTKDRFNAHARYSGCTYKVVFEVWDDPEGMVVAVISAYEVD